MAKHYVGINLGTGLTRQPTLGTSSGNTDVEVVITDGITGMNKVEIHKALIAIAGYIVTSNAPV